MKRLKHKLSLAVIMCAIPVAVWAVWPASDVNTTNMDSDFDSGTAARVDILDLTTKFNQLRNHVSTFIQGFLDDPDAATARATLGAVAASGGTLDNAVRVLAGSSAQVFGGERILARNDAPNFPVLGGYSSNVAYTESLLYLQTETAPATTWRLMDLRSAGGAPRFRIFGNGDIDSEGGAKFGGGVAVRTAGSTLTLDDTSGAQLSEISYRDNGVEVWVARQSNGAGRAYQIIESGVSTRVQINPGGATTITGNTTISGTLNTTNNLTENGVQVATTTGAQTLSNKTLSAPLITGTTTTSGTITSTKACATGFTRVLPNYCRSNTLLSASWTDATACTSRTLGGLPADAKLVHVTIVWDALAGNAVTLRQNNVTFYRDATCTSSSGQSFFSVQEFVATLAGLPIGRKDSSYILPLSGTDTIHTTQLNAGGNGNTDIFSRIVLGYFD